MSKPTNAELAEEFHRLRQDLDAARDALEHWGSYIETYYKNKHDFYSDIEGIEDAMKRAKDLAVLLESQDAEP